jgi:hypothetical protein
VKAECNLLGEQQQIPQRDPVLHGGGQAGPVAGGGRALVVPSEEPDAPCEECTHSLRLHDEDGFCTLSGCDCEGADDEMCPEAPLIRNDYGPDWWESGSTPRSSRRYRRTRLADFWPFPGRAKPKRAAGATFFSNHVANTATPVAKMTCRGASTAHAW